VQAAAASHLLDLRDPTVVRDVAFYESTNWLIDPAELRVNNDVRDTLAERAVSIGSDIGNDHSLAHEGVGKQLRGRSHS
jgi:hypothetical protein